MKISPKKVLLLSPHTDDIEIWCGWLVSKLLREWSEIYVCVFSDCKESVPSGFELNTLRNEFYNSMKTMWIKYENIYFLDFKVRYFSDDRQSILDSIVKIWKEVNPDLVLCHNTYDVHQDHETVTKEAIRYFKNTSIFWYELNWNNIKVENQIVIELEKDDIEKKIECLNCYESQKSFRKYFNDELIWAYAKVNWVKIRRDYAESFQAIRLVFN